MPKLCSITMEWEDAPETITPKELGKLRGMCLEKAREEFNKRGFPKIDRYKAKKSDLMKYYKIPTNKEEENSKIISLLSKINEKLELLVGSSEMEVFTNENAI